MPARSIATFTASATFSTIVGAADVLGQQPLAHREADGEPRLVGPARRARPGRVAKIGGVRADSTPSVPPDHTIGTCCDLLARGVPFATSTSRNARSAMIRV